MMNPLRMQNGQNKYILDLFPRLIIFDTYLYYSGRGSNNSQMYQNKKKY